MDLENNKNNNNTVGFFSDSDNASSDAETEIAAFMQGYQLFFISLQEVLEQFSNCIKIARSFSIGVIDTFKLPRTVHNFLVLIKSILSNPEIRKLISDDLQESSVVFNEGLIEEECDTAVVCIQGYLYQAEGSAGLTSELAKLLAQKFMHYDCFDKASLVHDSSYRYPM